MSQLVRCDYCGAEKPAESTTFWLRLHYTSQHRIESEDDGPEDFCSWQCTAQYAAEMAERPKA